MKEYTRHFCRFPKSIAWSLGRTSVPIKCAKRLRACISVATCLVALLILATSAAANVPTDSPILISQPTSTRAIALETVCFTPEPFALKSLFGSEADGQTRITLFAMNLRLQPGENLSLITAEAEDVAHRVYELKVEYVAPVPHQEWLTAVVVKLNENLSNVGDVLVRVAYRGEGSNRVRLGIGHLGGGPTDDAGAAPTPVKPHTISGLIRDDQNQGIDGIQVTLTNRIEGTMRTLITQGGGRFSFGEAPPGHSFLVTPTSSALFNFDTQGFEMLMSDRLLDFKGTRRSYSISGKLTGTLLRETVGVAIKLGGSRVASTISDSNGNYTFAGLPAGGTYEITVPSTPYYTFTSQGFTNLTSDRVANFEGLIRNYLIAGRVQLGPNAAPFLQVQISGWKTTSFTTDELGRFSIYLPAGGDFTITPSLAYHTFDGGSLTITNLRDDHPNLFFQGRRRSFTINGQARDQESNGLPGITVNLTGADQRTAITDANGKYEFPALLAGYDYLVTPPSTASYTFTGQNVKDLRADQSLNFIGLRRLLLSGRVRDQHGGGIIGVTVTLAGTESATTSTAADGSYSLTATATGNYTVTPSIAQSFFTFSPSSEQLNNLAGSKATDFTATLAPLPSPQYVLEFDGTPKTVDYGIFWQEGVDLGHFFWEFWAMPGQDAAATYLLSDGSGGAHALLFGVGSFNTSEPDRYELLGNIFDGVKHDNYFGSDVGPAIGEWGHFAVGWDGQDIYTYFNGVPVGRTPFAGPRRTPGPGGGAGRLLIGGSDHSNFEGRIAQVRGYESRNPREEAPGSVASSFAPQTFFSPDGNLLSWYFRSTPRVVADLSRGHDGRSHPGFLRGTTTGIIYYCETCPAPSFVIDPSAPDFATGTPPQPVLLQTPAEAPSEALTFDSFSRANSTLILGGNGGLGSSEGGSAGTKIWRSNGNPALPQPFGILNGRAVLLGNEMSVAWIDTRSASGSLDARVDRRTGRWGSGINTGLSFRVIDAENFFFAYTSEVGGAPGSQILKVGYYTNGQRVDLATGAAMPSSWRTLRTVTYANGDLQVLADNTLVYSTNSSLMANATGAGLYNNSAGMGLVNRWDNFTVFNLP